MCNFVPECDRNNVLISPPPPNPLAAASATLQPTNTKPPPPPPPRRRLHPHSPLVSVTSGRLTWGIFLCVSVWASRLVKGSQGRVSGWRDAGSIFGALIVRRSDSLFASLTQPRLRPNGFHAPTPCSPCYWLGVALLCFVSLFLWLFFVSDARRLSQTNRSHGISFPLLTYIYLSKTVHIMIDPSLFLSPLTPPGLR